jgi:hypothetical protein
MTFFGGFLRNHANGRAQGTNEGSVSSTHCVLPLLLQTPRDTKLLPVVQLRSGVILLMGDPAPDARPVDSRIARAFGCQGGQV